MIQIKNFFNGWTIFTFSIILLAFFMNIKDINVYPETKWFYLGTFLLISIARIIQIIKIKQRTNK
jgi:hypothetical protein